MIRAKKENDLLIEFVFWRLSKEVSMEITKEELAKEQQHLAKTLELIRKYISELGQELYDKEEKIKEFKELIWDTRHDMDPAEMRTMIGASDLEVTIAEARRKYFQKLFRIQESPYFASITFQAEGEDPQKIYIGITHVEEDLHYYVHDWRAPICSLFYDYEVGKASYQSPDGIVSGELTNKRQFKIERGKLKRVFDNSINIDDEVLQDVLSQESSDKMKNIVNTIQQEQNAVIRNTEDKALIVQGIAGSGKTSVALHRIAFLLYKINNLTSNNIIIFSPNHIFSEYISNVLPELGEENTLQCTFNGFLEANLTEFRHVEEFTAFIERYYKGKETNSAWVAYKQSDEIIDDLDQYIHDLNQQAYFIDGIVFDKIYYSKDELNHLLKRYQHFLLFERIPAIAYKLCDYHYEGKKGKAKQIISLLYKAFNIKKDFKQIYINFYHSKYFKNHYPTSLTDKEIKETVSKREIKYEDACVFTYLKGLLEGFEYRGLIKEVVIDEAQDYNKLQYHIIKNIFPRSNFTILGDVNQTINPYYKYHSLNELKEIFTEDCRYLELCKTYRSSQEIIEYTNKILGLNHIQAIRKKNNHPVIFRQEENLKEQLLTDIKKLKKNNKSIAIITKNDTEASLVYECLKEDIERISLLNTNTEKFNRDMVIIPSYNAKGLEFDAVIIYTTPDNFYKKSERYLYYVACTRCQHELIIYNQKEVF